LPRFRHVGLLECEWCRGPPKNYIEGYGYHNVALLRDLTPGATYQYTVACGGHVATRSFEVAPDGLTSYTALVLADMGYGSKGNVVLVHLAAAFMPGIRPSSVCRRMACMASGVQQPSVSESL